MVAAARSAGLVAIALTDHDTIGGVSEAQAAAATDGVRVIPGVELSAEDENLEIHVLGLHLSDLSVLRTRLTELREARVERAKAIVARLVELAAPVELDRVLGYAAGGAVGRPHIARALIDAGHASDFREAFDRYLGAGRPAYVAKARLGVDEAAELIHRAGGLAVWAHPGQCASPVRVRSLKALGLDGLEVLHPSHSSDDAARIGGMCEEMGLLPSGGSDWHAAPGSSRVLGSQAVPIAWLERQEAALATRAHAAHGA